MDGAWFAKGALKEKLHEHMVTVRFQYISKLKAGAKQPVHLFLGGKGLGIQQGKSVWVGLPKSSTQWPCINLGLELILEHTFFAHVSSVGQTDFVWRLYI